MGLWLGFELLTVCCQVGSSVPALALSVLTCCSQLGHNVIGLVLNLKAIVCGLVDCFQFAYSLLFSLVTVSLCLQLVSNHVFVCLASICWQFASSLGTVSMCLGPMWLGFSLLAVCFQLGHTLLVLGSSLKANVCGLVALCPFAHSMLPVWLQCQCVCSQVACRLLPAWPQCACAWIEFERDCVWACGLLAVCLKIADSLLPVFSQFLCA